MRDASENLGQICIAAFDDASDDCSTGSFYTDSVALESIPSRGPKPRSVRQSTREILPSNPESRLLSFLNGLMSIQPLSEDQLLTVEDQDSSLYRTCPELPSTHAAPADLVATYILEIDRLDIHSKNLSVATNRMYFKLGRAYAAAMKVSACSDFCLKPRLAEVKLTSSLCSNQFDDPTGLNWRATSSQQKDLFNVLTGRDDLKYLTTKLGYMRWQKRVQRAHKFFLLVEIFGLPILNAVPIVSVSRIDCLSLKMLGRLQTDRATTTTVREIKQRLFTIAADI